MLVGSWKYWAKSCEVSGQGIVRNSLPRLCGTQRVITSLSLCQFQIGENWDSENFSQGKQ